jgi:homeobox protein cut-like
MGDLEVAAGVDTSMLRVLCGQRDRLRHRVAELEEELNKCRQEATGVKNQLAAAKADNMALVERLRFAQSFKRREGGGGDVEAGGAGASAAVVKRYNAMYEDGINPFKEFQVSNCSIVSLLH